MLSGYWKDSRRYLMKAPSMSPAVDMAFHNLVLLPWYEPTHSVDACSQPEENHAL